MVPHVGHSVTNDDMIASIKLLATAGYIIPISKGRKWGALHLVFDVDTFKLQTLYEDKRKGTLNIESPFQLYRQLQLDYSPTTAASTSNDGFGSVAVIVIVRPFRSPSA